MITLLIMLANFFTFLSKRMLFFVVAFIKYSMKSLILKSSRFLRT